MLKSDKKYGACITKLLFLALNIVRIMPEINQSRYLVTATWDDVPHLDDDAKKELLESIPPYQRDSRSKGVPQLGSGAIYPILEEKITVDDFETPNYWPRAFAMDVGWQATACIWGAWDRQADCVYLYSCYRQGNAEPATHVDAILSRGSWIPGVIDPASRGRSQKDGVRLYDEYIGMGLNLSLADNAVEAGIHAIYRRLVSGRLKIFKSLFPWFSEYRLYRRDENGKVIKDDDHLMDCTRYLIMSAMELAVDEQVAKTPLDMSTFNIERDSMTGY